MLESDVSINYDNDAAEQDEILALDAQTLQLRYRFGRSLLNYVSDMAVVGEELLVCDKKNDRLQVFSLTGEHRRSITGEFKRPEYLCFAKNRLYLVESNSSLAYDEEERKEADAQLRGRRILVLSLQGDTLYTYAHPEQYRLRSMCYFDGKLLVPYWDASRGWGEACGVLALQGV